MKTDVGLWIDHREATIVTLTGEAETVKRIDSGMEKHVRFSGGAELGTAEDMRDRRFTNHLNEYFQEVISSVREADAILIFGPGEAKGELAKRLESENLGGRIVGIEAVDKLTERQIAARVREHFANKA
jgi:stalled ribosome rescue protein Dom34